MIHTKHSTRGSIVIFAGIFLNLLLLYPACLHANETGPGGQDVVFVSLGVSDGLSQSRAKHIVEDGFGFIWIATDDGLNRFDGHHFEVLRHVWNDENSLSSSIIERLYACNEKHVLWVATARGLNRISLSGGLVERIDLLDEEAEPAIFDVMASSNGTIWAVSHESGLFVLNPYGELLKHIVPGTPDSGLPPAIIDAILIDKSDRIWLSLRGYGLYVSTGHEGRFVFTVKAKHANSEEDWQISTMSQDSHGNLWMSGFSAPLLHYDPAAQKLKTIILSGKDSSIHFSAILEHGTDSLWMATAGNGLLLYYFPGGEVQQFQQSAVSGHLKVNSLLSLFADSYGRLWIGTNGGGISMMSDSGYPLRAFHQGQSSRPPLLFSSMRSLYSDGSDLLLAGGYGGLQRINLEKTEAKLLLGAEYTPYAILADQSNEEIIWIATELGNELLKYHLEHGIVDRFYAARIAEIDSSDKTTIRGHQLLSLLWAEDGRLLIGTTDALNLLDTDSRLISYFEHNINDHESLPRGPVQSLNRDSAGNIWVGSRYSGAALLDLKNGRFRRFVPGENGLLGQRINCIMSDSRQGVWLGTEAGLHEYLPGKGQFRAYTEYHGLINNMVYGILEDRQGSLWLSTNRGLSRFQIDNRVFLNLENLDGLPDNEFNTAAFFADRNGRLFFGGISGLVMVLPEKLYRHSFEYMPLISSVNLFRDGSYERHTFMCRQGMNIDRNVGHLVIELSAMVVQEISSSRFSYSLSYAGDDWIDLGSARVFSLTRPPAGSHWLRIRTTNALGEWSEHVLHLPLEVPPRLYEATWFRVLLVLLLFLSVFGYAMMHIRKLRREEAKLNRLVATRTNELLQANEMLEREKAARDQIYAIIGHDLKNPFHTILGYSDLLREKLNPGHKTESGIMLDHLQESAIQAMHLLENLLNWSASQQNPGIPGLVCLQLAPIAHEVANLVSQQTRMRGQQLNLEVSPELSLMADKRMLTVILRNLLSNSVRFTPIGGAISLSAWQNEDMVEICVGDNGSGIPNELLPYIFEPPHNKNKIQTIRQGGTGLGLQLCRKFAESMGGDIHAESQEGKGTWMYVRLRSCQLAGQSHESRQG